MISIMPTYWLLLIFSRLHPHNYFKVRFGGTTRFLLVATGVLTLGVLLMRGFGLLGGVGSF